MLECRESTPDGSGSKDKWLDGVHKEGPTSFGNPGSPLNWHVRLYESTWHNVGSIPGSSQGTRSVDHMACKITSTYSEAQ